MLRISAALTKVTATTEVITPILVEINGVLDTVLVEVKLLAGLPLDLLLLDVDGITILTVADVAQLVANLLFVSLTRPDFEQQF